MGPPTAGLRVALGILCHNRPADLAVALASAADQGFDEILVIDMASTPPIEPRAEVTWVRLEDNAGPVGRNHLVERTDCDVVAFLDDDASFRSPGVADRLRALFADPTLGAVAFLIERAGGRVESSEHPFRGPARPRPAQDCAYVVGAGHAVRRTSWVDVGGMDERFFYSTEEVDLGLRLAKAGRRCWYEPAIVVEHRPSAAGRSAPGQVVGFRLRNRIWLARRHLPALVGLVHVLVWATRTLAEAVTARDLRPWLRAWPAGLSGPADRAPLRWRTCVRLHRLGGRILW